METRTSSSTSLEGDITAQKLHTTSRKMGSRVAVEVDLEAITEVGSVEEEEDTKSMSTTMIQRFKKPNLPKRTIQES